MVPSSKLKYNRWFKFRRKKNIFHPKQSIIIKAFNSLVSKKIYTPFSSKRYKLPSKIAPSRKLLHLNIKRKKRRLYTKQQIDVRKKLIANLKFLYKKKKRSSL